MLALALTAFGGVPAMTRGCSRVDSLTKVQLRAEELRRAAEHQLEALRL